VWRDGTTLKENADEAALEVGLNVSDVYSKCLAISCWCIKAVHATLNCHCMHRALCLTSLHAIVTKFLK
jgi:hypothetical protein